MRILVVSDVVSQEIYRNFERNNYGQVDMIISCGDLPNYYMNFLIDAFNVPCFYVPGNHDFQFSKEKPPGWVYLHKRVLHHNGLTIAGLGGSRFYNGESKYQYTDSQMFWNCFKLSANLLWNQPIDIFVTHAPAFNLGDIKDSHVHSGFTQFNKLLLRHKPKLHLYGHVHLSYGVQRIGIFNDTLFINGYNFYTIDFDNLDSIKNVVPTQNIHKTTVKK